MNESSKERIKHAGGCGCSVLLVLIALLGLFLCLCGLLVWLMPDGDAEAGRICFFTGLVGLVLFGVPGILLARAMRKKKNKPAEAAPAPANGTFGERLKRMGGCGCAALVGMCVACVFVTLMGLIIWFGVEGEQTVGAVLFFIGLVSLAFFAGVGLVLPYVQWKKGIDVPPETPAVIAVPVSEPVRNDAGQSYGEKSPARKRAEKIGIAAVLTLTAIGVCVFAGWGIKAMRTAEEYRRVYDQPLVVSGVIYDHDSYDDDGDTDYRSYVRYQVNEITYTAKYQDVDVSEKLTAIGETVTFEVSPEHPERLLSYMKGESNFAIMIWLLLAAALALGYWAWMHGKRCNGHDAYADEEALRKNLMLTVFGRWRMAFWLLAALCGIGLVWRYPMLYGEKTMLFAAVCGGIWVVSALLAARDGIGVQRGEYEVHCDVLVDKKVISGEDSDTYRLIYRSGYNGKTWKTDVSKARYDRERVGATVHAVYIKGKKKPTMHYDSQGDVG